MTPRCTAITKKNLRCKARCVDTYCGVHKKECSICLENVVARTVTECGHVFCKKCIFTWLCDNETCPYCRCKLNSLFIGEAVHYGVANKIIKFIHVTYFNVKELPENVQEMIKKEVIVNKVIGVTEWIKMYKNYSPELRRTLKSVKKAQKIIMSHDRDFIFRQEKYYVYFI